MVSKLSQHAIITTMNEVFPWQAFSKLAPSTEADVWVAINI